LTKKKQFCPRGHDTFKIGRDASKRCLRCKAEDAAARDALVEQARAEARSRLERIQAEAERRREQEYRRAIAAGGDTAAEAEWQRLYDETLDKTEFGLCQWALENGQPGACTRRTANVYCAVHDRQLDREAAQRRRAKEKGD
jgi:hypothetical protein